MSDNSKAKGIITFKPEIRRESIRAIIYMSIYLISTYLMIGPLGKSNALAFGMALSNVIPSSQNDYTIEPVKNTFILLASNVGIIFLSYLGYGFFANGTPGYVTMVTVSTFITFFLAVYLFTSEKHSSTFMPLLLCFPVMLYRPVYGWDFVIRIAIFGGFALVSILYNFLIHGMSFNKKLKKRVDYTVGLLEKQCDSILNEEDKEKLISQKNAIDDSLTVIEQAIGEKLSISYRWQRGHDMVRTVTILKRINNTLMDNYINEGKKMSQGMHNLINEMLDSIDDFEDDKVSEESVTKEFDDLYVKLNSELDGETIVESVREEMDDFIQGEVLHIDKKESKVKISSDILNRFNIYSLIFALKVSCLASAGILVTTLFNLPNSYLFPLYVGITAQPYIEANSSSTKKRIINSIYVIGLMLISFSITNVVAVHYIVLIGITLFADMFFKFDYKAMIGTMFSVITYAIMSPDMIYSGSLYRITYIASACILLQIVDMFVFPRSIMTTLRKQMQYSLYLNDELRDALSNEETTYNDISKILIKKRKINQKIRSTNRYSQAPYVKEYLMADEEWINRLTMINHRLMEDGLKIGDFKEVIEHPDNLSHRLKNIFTAIDEVTWDVFNAEKIAGKIDYGKK
ncbi:FUSC family protein [Howardella ureilytica]